MEKKNVIAKNVNGIKIILISLVSEETEIQLKNHKRRKEKLQKKLVLFKKNLKNYKKK